MSKVTVLYHEDLDGVGSAYACWKKYGKEATYIPVNYGQDVPLIPEGTTDLFIVDFSYPPLTLIHMADKYKLVVIEHYERTGKLIKDLPFVIFDPTKSGAVLTWEYLFPDTLVPYQLMFVQDHDLWRHQLPDSEEVVLCLDSYDTNFILWDEFQHAEPALDGAAIKKYRDNWVIRALKDVRFIQIAEFRVPCVNVRKDIHSIVGNKLCQQYPDAEFAVTYFDRGDGKREYSLRSVGDFDVSAIAARFGGGGHKNAAGYTEAI